MNDEIKTAMDMLYSEDDPDPNYTNSEHGKVVDWRQEAYHDVTIYEDGHEERFYIGD